MRTTLTLDADVANMLRELSVKSGETFKSTVNRALRKGLAGEAPREKRSFRLVSKPMGLQPGIDPAGFNKPADDVEADTVVESTRRTRGKSASVRA